MSFIRGACRFVMTRHFLFWFVFFFVSSQIHLWQGGHFENPLWVLVGVQMVNGVYVLFEALLLVLLYWLFVKGLERLSLSLSDRERAFHESGHATVFACLISPPIVELATIESGRMSGGHVRTRRLEGQVTGRLMYAVIGGMCAGKVSAEFSGERAGGWEWDYLDALRIARTILDIEDEMSVIVLSGPHVLRALFTTEGMILRTLHRNPRLAKIIEAGERLAREAIRRNQPVFEAIAEELVRNGTVEGDRLQEMLRDIVPIDDDEYRRILLGK